MEGFITSDNLLVVLVFKYQCNLFVMCLVWEVLLGNWEQSPCLFLDRGGAMYSGALQFQFSKVPHTSGAKLSLD